MASTLQAEAAAWISEVLGEPIDAGDGFVPKLKSGVVLANLLNKLRPGSCPKPSTSSLAFAQMENISAFITAARYEFEPKTMKQLIHRKACALVTRTSLRISSILTREHLCYVIGIDRPLQADDISVAFFIFTGTSECPNTICSSRLTFSKSEQSALW